MDRVIPTASVLEEKHLISTLMYLLDNDGCTKTELYNGVSNNPRMPYKLAQLEGLGLLTMRMAEESRAMRVFLTEKGKTIGLLLRDIDTELGIPYVQDGDADRSI